MNEVKSNVETEKPLDKPSLQSEISKKEADSVLDRRLEQVNANENQNETNNSDVPTSLEPNSKYYKDGHTYETDDKGNIYKVDGNLLPNADYEVNGYKYKTDDNGRIVSVSGQIRMESGKRDIKSQTKAGGEDRQPGDQGGHLIADRFGGSGGLENLVAMKSELNQGEYKKLENDLAKAVSEGKEVTVSIRVKYNGESQRPTSITVIYSIDGETVKKTFTN